jgi:PBP1b-binding outer membrane lipoprotein LpoB
MMKKLFSLLLLVAIFAACNNEPKLEQEEEKAVATQLEADQKSMDSLEAAILSQMEDVNLDSLESE